MPLTEEAKKKKNKQITTSTSYLQGQIKSRNAYEQWKKENKSNSASQAANDIKKSVQNGAQYGGVTKKSTATTDSKYGNATKGRGLTKKETANVKQGSKELWKNVKKDIKKAYDKSNVGSGEYKTFDAMHRQYKSDGTYHVGGNGRHTAYSDPALGMYREKTYSDNAGARFVGNAAESLMDNSVFAVPYTVATGKKLSQSDFLSSPIYDANPEWQQTADELRAKSHEGIAAGAGRMAGMAVNYGMMRSALDPKLEQATNAIMNGTRLGETIKGSAVLGKIGQATGTNIAQDIGKGLVKESLSDATLGFGQNALLNYGEGLRGTDFWEQQAKDTALDFLVGGVMEGAGIGKQIRGVNRETKNIISENPTSMLDPSISKEDYLADLWERMNARMGTHNNLDNAAKLRDAAYNKVDDLLEEYNKVVDMTPKQFKNYQNGRDLDYINATRGKKVKNAYEGDLESVRKTPLDKREKFGGRPKEDGEAATVKAEEPAVNEPVETKAESPEPEVKNTVDETTTVSEPEVKEASTQAKDEVPDKATSLKESQDAMNEIHDALDNGELDKAHKLMDELDKKLTEIENNSGSKTKGKKGKPKEEGAKEAKPKKTKQETKPAETVKQSEETAPKEKKNKIKESIKEDNGYKVGDKVVHKNFGKGEVIGFEEFTRNKKKYRNAVIRFEDGTEDVISHTDATETGFLKHADANADTVAKAEKEVALETPTKTSVKEEPTVEAETPKNTNAEKESGNAKGSLPTEKEVKEATTPETTSRKAIDKLTNNQLADMCKDYEIEVVPTGKKGKPVHKDYVDAVSKHFEKAEGQESLEAAISKAKEKPAPPKAESAKSIPTKDIESPDELEVGKYVVHEEKGIGKIVGFKNDKTLGRTMKVEFADDSMEQMVDKASLRWKMYAGDDTPELAMLHKPKGDTTISGDTATTVKAKGDASTTTASGGTETFTSTADTSGTGKKPLKQLRKKKNTDLPKGEKVNTKGETSSKKKPITSSSSYQEVEERLGGSEKNKYLREIEEFISKYDSKDTAKAMETYLRSDKISPEAKKIIMEMRENGEAFTKEVVTNKSVLEEAERRIKDDFNGTIAAFFNKAKSGEQFTSQDMADGFQIAKKLMENGDFRKAAEVNGELSAALSENARFLQSQRMWRSLTPEGRISSTLASIRKLEKSQGMKKGTIRIGEEGERLLKAIYDAKSNKDIAEANKAFATYVWNQVPRTFAEKANAWRYLAMLGNPKTHIRNVLGNALFIPSRKISDTFATVLEQAYSKKLKEFGGDATRRHAIINHFSAEDRALLKKAGENFKDDRDLLESISSKMFERQRAEGSSTFKTKYLDFLEKFNTKALNQEDVAFMSLNYKSAYAQYCKANGIKASDITDEIAKKASEYAQDQALKATYRDANRLADAFNKMRKSLVPKKSDDSMMKLGKRAGGFLMDSTIPFVKTPLNILKRGTLEYSPVGIARGLGRIVGASDANSLLKGIEYMSNGLTGTGVLALGMFLANKGFVNGSLGEWGKDKAYSQMLGEQDYSVNVGDKTITLDWVAPMSMPFFVGVEAATAMADGINGTEILESMSNISDPIFEMSMLQGIENNFNMAFSDKKGLGTIAKNAGFNYLSQFVPTLAGQISRTRVRDRKTVVSTSTDPFVKTLEKNFGKILNKVPIAGDVLNQDYVDLWGRTDSKENAKDYLTSGLENMFSPAYISKRNETAVDKEIKDLYSKLGEEDKEKILPTFASNAFKQKLDDKEYNMTPAEFTQYKKTVGQTRYKGLEELFKTSKYKNASDDEKRKMIESVYDDANNAGKKEYLAKVDKEFASAPDFYMLDEKKREKYDESINMSKQDWAKAYTAATKANSEVYSESGLNLSNTEKALVLAENGVTSLEQAKTIYKNISENAWDNGYKAHQLGKTVEDVQREAIARENMTETERTFDSNFRSRSEIRYLSSNNAPINNDLYNKYLDIVQKADKSNDDNGTIKQSEAQNAIEYLNRKYGLTNAQKAYLWHLSEGDDGWKKQPYGKWND